MSPLDDELRQAAARLRRATDELEVPDLQSSSPHRWQVVAVILLVAVGLTFVAASWSGGPSDNNRAVAGGGPSMTPENPLPDGRGVTISMTDSPTAGTSAAEYCAGVDDPTLCVFVDREPRATWSVSASSDACEGGDVLLYGVTTLTAAVSFEYRGSGADLVVTDKVWPRAVAVPSTEDATIAEQASTFAACVPGDGSGHLSLYGGFSEDRGENVVIATDVPRSSPSE